MLMYYSQNLVVFSFLVLGMIQITVNAISSFVTDFKEYGLCLRQKRPSFVLFSFHLIQVGVSRQANSA